MIDEIDLKYKSIKDCYLEIAESIRGESDYYTKLAKAMEIWVDILK